MEQKIKVAIAGLGSRGKDVYARALERFSDKVEITAVADIDAQKTAIAARRYHIPEERCFASAEELLEQDRLADVMVIATQDRQHVGHAIPALRKGYHLLLEKPVSPFLEECVELARVAKECERMVVVCHVLRYTPIYRKVKEILDSGKIGEVVSIAASENVGWYHMAHSFVRGNWRNSDETSPMILQKCCHDMDLYLWLAGKTCESVSSYGSTYLFKEENAPEGSTAYCLDGCSHRGICPFDAESIYLDNEKIGCRKGNHGWPLDVLVEAPTEEDVLETLRNGRYGRCVYHCDNNVVDHQVVNLQMTDGSTMSFTMSGFSQNIERIAVFYGTKGQLDVTMGSSGKADSRLEVRMFTPDCPVERINVSELADDFSGHGGGDAVMVEEFLQILLGERVSSSAVTTLEQSLESHYCALAAEQSRLRGGQVVWLDEMRRG